MKTPTNNGAMLFRSSYAHTNDNLSVLCICLCSRNVHLTGTFTFSSSVRPGPIHRLPARSTYWPMWVLTPFDAQHNVFKCVREKERLVIKCLNCTTKENMKMVTRQSFRDIFNRLVTGIGNRPMLDVPSGVSGGTMKYRCRGGSQYLWISYAFTDTNGDAQEIQLTWFMRLRYHLSSMFFSKTLYLNINIIRVSRYPLPPAHWSIPPLVRGSGAPI